MKSLLPILTLVAASSAFAQTAPNVAKKSPLQHSLEVGYVTSSAVFDGAPAVVDDFSGYNLAAKVYVWQNVFLALEYVDSSADINSADPDIPDQINVSRFGYGIGASFDLVGGQLSVSYTFGEAEFETEGGIAPPGDNTNDQGRANVTFSHTYQNGVSASVGVTQFLNDDVDDETAFILGVGYDFKNGLSVNATYSPNSSDLGVGEMSEDTFSLGVKYSF